MTTFSSLACPRQTLHQSSTQILSVCKKSRLKKKNGSMQPLNAAKRPEGGVMEGVPGRNFCTQPQWLLPINEDGMFMLQDGALSTFNGCNNVDSCKVVYKVILRTSNDYKSEISDSNAGVLLGVIGQHGKCFICRISPLDVSDTASVNLPSKECFSKILSQKRFQKGSSDVITFNGPDLGRLEAVWIAPEAGTWRMEEITIAVLSPKASVDGFYGEEKGDCRILLYNFLGKDILIGDGNWVPATELTVSLVQQITYADYLLLDTNIKTYGRVKSVQEIREQWMKEYRTLKVSLLSYTAMLVMFGTAISVVAGFIEIAKGFSVGGCAGFFYLLVLQKAVDQLPVLSASSNSMPETLISVTDELHPSSTSCKNGTKEQDMGLTTFSGDCVDEIPREHVQLLGNLVGFRAPLTSFTGVIALSALILKLSPTTRIDPISKEMLLAGAAGFLMSKIAIVLASNKPFSINLHS